MKIFQYFTLLVFILAGLSACADKEDKYDKDKAVLAIASHDSLEINPTLTKQKIKIPQEKNLSHYDQSLAYNNKIENFKFTPLNDEKFLNKKKQFWSGYRGLYHDRYVFEPVITDDKIYLLDASGILTAYNLETKKRIYKQRIFPTRYFRNYQNPRLSLHNNRLFAIAGTNQIYAINPKNGEIIWDKEILAIPFSTIASDGKNIYFATDSNKTYALNFDDGKIEWISSSYPSDTAIFGSAKPLISGNKLIISYSSGELNCLNKNNGETLWTQNLNLNKAVNSNFYLNDIDATPKIKDGKLFAIGNGGLMMAINLQNGKFIWKKRLASITDFWIASDFIFLIDNDDKLICLSQKTGDVKYVSQLEKYRNENNPKSKNIYNGIIMAGGKLILANQREVLVANPQDGTVEQTIYLRQKSFHTPIVINGKIILHSVGKYSINLMEIW